MKQAIRAAIIVVAIVARAAADKPAATSVNLPYSVNFGGQQWIIQRGGWLQQQGNMPVFAQAANLTINGQPVQGNARSALLDKESGELIVENQPTAGLSVTRRILLNKDAQYVRYVDVFANRTAQEQTAQVMIQSSLNFGVNAADVVNDPRNAQNAIAWIAQTGAGPAVVEVFAGVGSKLSPDVNFQQGNSFVQATFKLVVPANKQAALVHLRGIQPTTESGQEFVAKLKDAALLKDVPADIKKIIANFRPTGVALADRPLLRGDTLDVIELRSGDQLRGTLEAPTFEIETGFGLVSLPEDTVIGLLATGAFRPRQLLITRDGEIFGGVFKGDSIAIKLSSGQTTAVPLSQIARVGCRLRDGEAEEIPFTKPLVILRSGDRLAFVPRAETVDILTRFGLHKLPLNQFALIDLQATESALHVATMIDGSRFGGLLTSSAMTFTLATTGKEITLPVAAMAALQMKGDTADAPVSTATLELQGGDLLAAPLSGELHLDTAFDTITLNAGEIAGLSPIDDSPTDVQVTLWDKTVVSGQLREANVACRLAGNVDVAVPSALVKSYRQTSPRPAAAAVERIRATVAELSASDFQTRQRAEQALQQMGQTAVPILKELRDSQPLEGQQRIDSLLKGLSGR